LFADTVMHGPAALLTGCYSTSESSSFRWL